MFAVIKTGGKQYRVAPDDVIRIEKIEGAEGSRVQFANVLMVGEGSDVSIGAPSVDGATVTAEVLEQGRGKKTISFKKRRRQNSRRKQGHRQYLTTVSILEILTNNAKPKRDASGRTAEDRRSEATAAFLASRGGDSVSEDAAGEAPAAESKPNKSSRAEAKDVQDADDAGLIEGSETDAAVAVAAPETKGASVPAEDDVAADREAEMAAEAKAASKPAKKANDDAPTPPSEPMFTAPEGEKDKLTKIKGIGPVAEGQLNDQGITTFAQIAALSDEDIERIDANMPFSAAQIRTWREQAEELK